MYVGIGGTFDALVYIYSILIDLRYFSSATILLNNFLDS